MNTYQKILTGAVLVLIIANLALLGFIWMERAPRNPDRTEEMRRGRMRGYLENELGLDSLQLAAFQNLQKQHQKAAGRLNRQMRNLNRDIHEIIINEDEQKEAVISQKMDSIHHLIKNENFEFVRALSNLCRADQKKKLFKVLNELPDRQGYRGNRPPDRETKD